MVTRCAVHVQNAHGPLDLVDVETARPTRDHVRIEVQTMNFAVLNGIRERPLEEGAQAYAAIEQGQARYRMVLTM